MIRNIFLVCVAMLGIVGQSVANPMPCSSLTMNDEASMDIPDCTDMEMSAEQNEGTNPQDCCSGDCVAMLQCSQVNATFDANIYLPNTVLLIASLILITPMDTPHGVSSSPEIKPPIVA